LKILKTTHQVTSNSAKRSHLGGDRGEIVLLSETCYKHQDKQCSCRRMFVGLESGMQTQVAVVDDYDMTVEELASKIEKYAKCNQGAAAKAIAMMTLANKFSVKTELIRKSEDQVEIGWVPPNSQYKSSKKMCTVLDNPSSISVLGGANYKPSVAVRINLDGTEIVAIPYAAEIISGKFKQIVDEYNKLGGELQAD
jgi:hypothetical protein